MMSLLFGGHFNKMPRSDLKHCDTDVYENTRTCTAGGKPDINQDAIELQTTEEHYEDLTFVSREGSCRNINEENKTKVIQWKDVPTQIRYSIYALSLMMTILYIAVITAAVLIYVIPKSEDENNSGGGWSSWGTWGPCSESCGGGIKSRLRTCSNPRPTVPGKGCDGSSEQVALCNKNTCDDLKVTFLATGCLTENSSYVIKFTSIQYNSGNGYNPRTGRFTCKIPGIYNFAVTLTKVRGDIDIIEAYLRINGDNILQLYSNPSETGDIDFGSYSLSVTGNFYLGTYDYVDVYSITKYFYDDYSTLFTGVLVIPDN